MPQGLRQVHSQWHGAYSAGVAIFIVETLPFTQLRALVLNLDPKALAPSRYHPLSTTFYIPTQFYKFVTFKLCFFMSTKKSLLQSALVGLCLEMPSMCARAYNSHAVRAWLGLRWAPLHVPQGHVPAACLQDPVRHCWHGA